jgi:hypothetical protein
MNAMTEWEQVAITTLLRQRFDDGWVCLRGREDRRFLRRAFRLGFVDEDGYLTRTGERFLETQAPAWPREHA